jgi:hypothetical protein
MVLYLSIAFILFCLAFLRLVGAIDRRYENMIALCLTAIGFIFAAIRWETGTDWETYRTMYGNLTSIASARQQSWWGPGYAYIAVFLNQWRAGFTVFLTCVAAILFSAKYRALVRTSSAPLIVIFALFCVNFYDVFFVRENVAAIFFWLFAFSYYNKSFATAVLYGLVSVCFHSSAAIPIAVVLALGRPHWKMLAILVVISICAAYLLLTRLALPDLLKLAGIAAYVAADYVEPKNTALSTTLRAYLKLAYWFLVAIGCYTLLRQRNGTSGSEAEPDDGWTAFCLRCGTGIMIITAFLLPLSEVFSRIPNYALPMFAVVLANYRLNFRKLSAADAAYLALLVLLFVQLVFLYSSFSDYYYPFKTIL